MEQITIEEENLQKLLKSEIEGLAFYLEQPEYDAEQKALRLINANRNLQEMVSQIEILRKLRTRAERNMKMER